MGLESERHIVKGTLLLDNRLLGQRDEVRRLTVQFQGLAGLQPGKVKQLFNLRGHPL